MAIGRRINETKSQSWARHSQTQLRHKKDPVSDSDAFCLSEPERFPQLSGRLQVSGHRLNDPQHSAYPSSRYEIRCYAPGAHGEVHSLSFEELVAAQQRPFQSELRLTLQAQPSQPRAEGQILPMLAPKDHSLQLDSMDIGYDGTSASRVFLKQLSQIGVVEEFQVRALVDHSEMAKVEQFLFDGGYSNYQLHPSSRPGSWPEDYSEPLLQGGRVVPAPFEVKGKSLSEVLSETRRARYEPLGLSSDFTAQGAVDRGGYQKQGQIQGYLYGEKVYQAQSYVEGGNLISGLRADGTPYVLIGQDSMELSRALLTEKLGRPASDDELKQSLAADYGVLPGQVFGVEQPAEFHLDMRMTPVAPGVMALQDSKLAAQMQAAWIREEMGSQLTPAQNERIEAMILKAETAAQYEALTRRDLEKAGIKVIPLAGVFRNLDDQVSDGANFFNARHGTNASGEKYTVMMGGTARQEAYIAEQLLGHHGLPIDRLYFLDPEQNRETLPKHGGLKCRTKPHGQLASNQL